MKTYLESFFVMMISQGERIYIGMESCFDTIVTH
jgi:hypothetical protein